MPPIRVLTVYCRVSGMPVILEGRRFASALRASTPSAIRRLATSYMQNLFHIGRKHVTVLDENADESILYFVANFGFDGGKISFIIPF
jgi:hypothetical protein